MCFGTSYLSESSQKFLEGKKPPSLCQVRKWRAEGFSSGSALSTVGEEAAFELGGLTPPSSLHHRAQSPSCWSPQLLALRRGPSAPSPLTALLNLTPPDPALLPGHPGARARSFPLLWSSFPVCCMLSVGPLYIYNNHFLLWPLLLCRPAVQGWGE